MSQLLSEPLPDVKDPAISAKLAEHAAFEDTEWAAEVPRDNESLAAFVAKLEKQPPQFQAHQHFVQRFMSPHTPYRSLLLYHGVGSGKTCSAIGICEELRLAGAVQLPIWIVAPHPVHRQFRKSLLKRDALQRAKNGTKSGGGGGGGGWSMSTCGGPTLLSSLFQEGGVDGAAAAGKSESEEAVWTRLEQLVDAAYRFLTFEELEIAVKELLRQSSSSSSSSASGRTKGTMIVVDEVHRLRMHPAIVADLEEAARRQRGMRWLFLSATPLFYSPTEIVWQLNLMNHNDRRAGLVEEEVFASTTSSLWTEGGKALLRRKATGYISFVKGENPFTFPYRVTPKWFAPDKSFAVQPQSTHFCQGSIIPARMQFSAILDPYLNTLSDCGRRCGRCQHCVYLHMVETIAQHPEQWRPEYFGYALQALTMAFPHPSLKKAMAADAAAMPAAAAMVGAANTTTTTDLGWMDRWLRTSEVRADPTSVAEEELVVVSVPALWKEMVGAKGLHRFVESPTLGGPYRYRPNAAPIFAADHLPTFSHKLHAVMEQVRQCHGIVLICSQFVEGGLIPAALALESVLHFRRAGAPSLWSPAAAAAAATATARSEGGNKHAVGSGGGGAGGGEREREKRANHSYVILSSDRHLSPDNDAAMDTVTSEHNVRGEQVKVVLLSSEFLDGLDFQNIRQVHMLDPLPTISAVEQLVGRAVRQWSHKALPLAERNVQIFLHGTVLQPVASPLPPVGKQEGSANTVECVDLLYMHVVQEKARDIGEVSRVLKGCAVDCVLNADQQREWNREVLDIQLTLTLADGRQVEHFPVGDAPFSANCDYQETCSYPCAQATSTSTSTSAEEDGEGKGEGKGEGEHVGNQHGGQNRHRRKKNAPSLRQRMADVFQDGLVYHVDQFVDAVRAHHPFSYAEIYAALKKFRDGGLMVIDMFGRQGFMRQVGDLVVFHPISPKVAGAAAGPTTTITTT